MEQDRTELDEAQGRLAPGDDGVHTGAIAVVGTDAAIAITVESGGVTTGTAISFTSDQIDERRFLGLLHGSLSLVGRVGRRRNGAWVSVNAVAKTPAPCAPATWSLAKKCTALADAPGCSSKCFVAT